MSKKKKTSQVYISPDEIVYTGSQWGGHATIDLIDFGPNHCVEKRVKSINVIKKYSALDSLTWVRFNALHDVEVIKQLQSKEIHDYVLSNVLDTAVRPTFHEEEDIFFITLKVLEYDKDNIKLAPQHFSLIIVENCLYTFSEHETTLFNPLIEDIKKGKRRIIENDLDYLVYRVLDIIVSNYQFLIRELGEEIDDLEELILTDQKNEILDKIILYKKLSHSIKRIIKPTLEMMNKVSKYDSDIIQEKSQYFFNELLNDLKHVSEMVDGFRDTLSDQLNIYHTMISSKLNSVMMTLTVFSVIFIPLTFIVGVYGTNFEYIPELHYHYSYFIMWGIMLLSTICMLFFFIRKKWIKF